MESIPENTPRQLLSIFYEKYDLEKDGGFKDSKVKIVIAKNFYFYIPNSETRRKALLKHDIHHLITGYNSDFRGETEISGWEIASGCNNYWAAWILDIWGMMYGFWFNLTKVFKSFVRGRRSKNLYGDTIQDEVVLDIPVHQLQEILHIPYIDEPLTPVVLDYLYFIFWMIAGSIFSIASIVLLPLAILYNLYLVFTGKF